MTLQEIKARVIQLVLELFKNNGTDTKFIEYVDLVDDLGMDSITFISIIVEIESQFKIMIPDSLLLMDNFKHIDDIAVIIYRQLSNKAKEMEENINVEN